MFTADLNNTIAAANLVKKLPCEATASRWGDEVFLPVRDVQPSGEFPTRQVDIGDVAFSFNTQNLCVFFGPTPASMVGKPVAETPVVVIGTTMASPDELRRLNAGDRISVTVCDTVPAVSNPALGSGARSTDPYGERKLSQTEIDDLVKRLVREMEEKKRQIHQQPGM